ncbi:transporter [Halocalculus aciditolerans]|uniref:Transporter n=1 Tax=Halocalculus aciditolerans TaxID=1383812 RepID=A0A830FFG4_9EURY|nr:transporter [Halocalculus aciditolerans]
MLLIASVGYLLASVRDIDVDGLGTVAVYILTPALVFDSLATTDLGGGSIARIAVGFVVVVAALAVLVEALGRLRGRSVGERSALVLTSAFPNCGNYGIPLCAFAFGAVGRTTAVIFVTVQSVVVYTLGVWIASRAGGGRGLAAVREVFKLPLLYAVVAAALARALDLVPPSGSSLMDAISMVGDAAIPVMLLVLGIQLANTDAGASLRRVATPTTVKLAVAPAIAAAVAVAFTRVGFGFTDSAIGRAFVLEWATPAAVTPLVLTVEFARDADIGGLSPPEYVSSVIFVTTVLSVATVAAAIAVLESGVLGI